MNGKRKRKLMKPLVEIEYPEDRLARFNVTPSESSIYWINYYNFASNNTSFNMSRCMNFERDERQEMIDYMQELYLNPHFEREEKRAIADYIESLKNDPINMHNFRDPKSSRLRSVFNFIFSKQNYWEKASKAKSDLLNALLDAKD